jgi:hypothetical protein
MESRVMNQPPKFHIKLLGVDIGAEGVLGIVATCFLVVFLFVVWRY